MTKMNKLKPKLCKVKVKNTPFKEFLSLNLTNCLTIATEQSNNNEGITPR